MSTLGLMWLALGLAFGLFAMEHFVSIGLRKQLIRETELRDMFMSIGNEALKQLEQEKNKNHELSLELNSLKRRVVPKS
tara:strand:+ start:326 stop:562 length:237 start_codon:yes stop_codon:yes gene_type:complete